MSRPDRAVDSRQLPDPASATLPHRGTRRGAGALEAAPRARRQPTRWRRAPDREGSRSGERGRTVVHSPLPPSPARLRLAMAVVGVLAFLAAAAGIAVPATHTTRTTADEPQYLLTAISLARDGDLDIADELAEGAWRPFHALPLPEQTVPLGDGRRLSPHDPLLPLLLAGPVALGGWVGAKLATALLAGLLAALLVWTAVRRLGVPVAPAALAMLAAVAALAGPGPPSRQATLVVGGAVVALPWLGVKYAPVAAALALVACWRLARGGRGRRALALAGSLAAAGVAFLVLHRWWYGGWTPYAAGDHFVAGELTVVGVEPDYLG